MSRIVTFLGGLLTVYGVLILLIMNLNVGVLMTLALGLFVLACGLFSKQIKAFVKTRWGKTLATVLALLLLLELLLVSFIAIYGQSDNAEYNEEAVVVLGAGLRGDQITWPLKYRLDAAIAYHRQNPDALIVVSGGQGFQETVPEAVAMADYLMRHGVDPTHIIKEDQSTSTAENMRFSKVLLDERFDRPYRVVVVTNNFHIYRGVQIAASEGFEQVRHLHAGIKWYDVIPCYLRESLAVLKLWLID